MKIRNNSEYDLTDTIISIHTDSMNIALAMPLQTDEEIEEASKVVVGKSFATYIIKDAVKAGNISPTEGLLLGLDNISAEWESAQASVFKPLAKSMKAFVAAIYEAITNGDVSPIKEFEENVGDLPTEVKNYIKELIDK